MKPTFRLSDNTEADRLLLQAYKDHKDGTKRGFEGTLAMYLIFTGLRRRFVLVRLAYNYQEKN